MKLSRSRRRDYRSLRVNVTRTVESPLIRLYAAVVRSYYDRPRQTRNWSAERRRRRETSRLARKAKEEGNDKSKRNTVVTVHTVAREPAEFSFRSFHLDAVAPITVLFSSPRSSKTNSRFSLLVLSSSFCRVLRMCPVSSVGNEKLFLFAYLAMKSPPRVVDRLCMFKWLPFRCWIMRIANNSRVKIMVHSVDSKAWIVFIRRGILFVIQ